MHLFDYPRKFSSWLVCPFDPNVLFELINSSKLNKSIITEQEIEILHFDFATEFSLATVWRIWWGKLSVFEGKVWCCQGDKNLISDIIVWTFQGFLNFIGGSLKNKINLQKCCPPIILQSKCFIYIHGNKAQLSGLYLETAWLLRAIILPFYWNSTYLLFHPILQSTIWYFLKKED